MVQHSLEVPWMTGEFEISLVDIDQEGRHLEPFYVPYIQRLSFCKKQLQLTAGEKK